MKAFGIIIAVATVGGGGWFGYSRLYGQNEGGAFVVQELDRGSIIKTVAATGTVEPLIKIIVGSQVSGNIKKWHADFNQRVTQGFVLAELDPERFQTAFDQSKAALTLSRAREEEALVRFKDAQREANRIKALMDRNHASENEYLVAKAVEDGATAAWHGTQAQVEQSEAALKEAQVDLDRTIIRSPIDGVVIARNIEDGQTVAASLQAPELFVIANDLKRMQVHASVSESDIGLIAEGLPAKFTVDAYPRRIYEGIISQIRFNPTVVDNVVTYVTLIEVDNEDLTLRPGMTANVSFEVAKAEDVIRIPNAALRFNPAPPGAGADPAARRRSPTIYRLVGGRPQPESVKVGLSDGTYTELAEGDLAEGESVITERNWGGGRGRRDMTRMFR